jgi:hypothetical protein
MIIDANLSDWPVDEPGVMLLSASFGRVFIPVSMLVSDEVAPESWDRSRHAREQSSTNPMGAEELRKLPAASRGLVSQRQALF